MPGVPVPAGNPPIGTTPPLGCATVAIGEPYVVPIGTGAVLVATIAEGTGTNAAEYVTPFPTVMLAGGCIDALTAIALFMFGVVGIE